MNNYHLNIYKVIAFQLLILLPKTAISHHVDPSDPTQLNTSYRFTFEKKRLDGQQITSGFIAGKYRFNNFQIAADIGYGLNEQTDESDMRDIQFQLYQRTFHNEEINGGLRSFGWAVDVTVPASDYTNGVSYGYKTFSPGIIAAFSSVDSIIEYYPQLSYQYAVADDDDLKRALQAQGLSEDIQQLVLDLGISPKMDNPLYLTLTPGYAWTDGYTDNRVYLQVLAGLFVLKSSALELYAQFDFNSTQSIENQNGEGNFVRINWETYF